MSKVTCPQHPEETISNFCCIRSCLRPLCPDCIDDHISEHAEKGQKATVETLNRLKNKSDVLLSSVTKILESDLALLNNETGLDFEEIKSKSIDELRKFKAKVMEQVNLYFVSLEREFEEKLSQVKKEAPETTGLKSNLSKITDYLKALRSNLDTSELFESINSCVRMDVKPMLEKYHGLIDDAILRSVQLPIHFDYDPNFSGLNHELQKVVRISNKDVKLATNHDYLMEMKQRRTDDTAMEAAEYFMKRFV